ncbi:hypothetical protein BOTBODRAFT_139049, partial [Botryobasidium botryosum FD-172 SS1]
MFILLSWGRASPDVTRLLIRHGADVNKVVNDAGWTPLHVLCCRDITSDLPILSQLFGILLDSGANVNAKDRHGYTPLHYACHRFWHEKGLILSLISLLVTAGADTNASANLGVHARDYKGLSPLHWAARGSHNWANLKEMLIAGANIDICDHLGRTPLHHAVRLATPKITKRLISSGANAEALDKHGDTPLTLAVRAG